MCGSRHGIGVNTGQIDVRDRWATSIALNDNIIPLSYRKCQIPLRKCRIFATLTLEFERYDCGERREFVRRVNQNVV